ncbi:Uncharacterized protein Fot_54836 [Forsythia ovata]|uniref:Uncharacterized protein n=1 Tax=Forsythia ovata TaxID=205694 RepID=A0ABD1P6T3_9LAMI
MDGYTEVEHDSAQIQAHSSKTGGQNRHCQFSPAKVEALPFQKRPAHVLKPFGEESMQKIVAVGWAARCGRVAGGGGRVENADDMFFVHVELKITTMLVVVAALVAKALMVCASCLNLDPLLSGPSKPAMEEYP